MSTAKNTFLFSWNPNKYAWPELGEDVEAVKRGENVKDSWTCASHKKIQVGDRTFISIVGIAQRGVFASGHVSSPPFIGKNRKGNDCYRVLVTFDVLLNPYIEDILTLDILNMGNTSKQLWTPQGSGISIKPEVVEELELLWKDLLSERK